MSRDELLVAGDALRCGDVVLVPVVRASARTLGGVVLDAQIDVVGFLAHPRGAPARFFAATESPPHGSASWNDWLALQPALLAAIRERLVAAG